jgi:CRP-like cAMP-binding protein
MFNFVKYHRFMASIIDSFNLRKHLKAEQMAEFEQLIQTKTVSKGQILLRKGDVLAKAFFVKQGCLRSYSIDEKGKEHVFMFAPEGWLVGDISMQFKNTPSDLFIDAIEDSEVEIIDYLVESMLPKSHGASHEKLIKRIAVLQKRVIMLMSATAWERYQDFLETYPNIIQRVPQRMIASYLGITPEALSKLRGDNAKK